MYEKLFPGKPKILESTVKLSAYGGTEIPNVGSCKLFVQGHNNPHPTAIQAEIVNCEGPVIIGNETARQLGLLKLNWPISAAPLSSNASQQVKRHPSPLTREYLLQEYSDVFTGIGCFPGPAYQITIDPSATPVQHPPRQTPVQLQPAFQSELKRLEEDPSPMVLCASALTHVI